MWNDSLRGRPLGEIAWALNTYLRAHQPSEHFEGLGTWWWTWGKDHGAEDSAVIPPRTRWIACYAVEGDSEGHYIHVDAIVQHPSFEKGVPHESYPLFLGKTFGGREDAYRTAQKCAEFFESWDPITFPEKESNREH